MWAIDSSGLLTIVKFKCLENFENAHIARKWQLKYVPNECNCAFQHKQSHILSIVQLQSHRYFHFDSIGRYFTRNSSNINAEQHPKQVGRKKKSLVFTQRASDFVGWAIIRNICTWANTKITIVTLTNTQLLRIYAVLCTLLFVSTFHVDMMLQHACSRMSGDSSVNQSQWIYNNRWWKNWNEKKNKLWFRAFHFENAKSCVRTYLISTFPFGNICVGLNKWISMDVILIHAECSIKKVDSYVLKKRNQIRLISSKENARRFSRTFCD